MNALLSAEFKKQMHSLKHRAKQHGSSSFTGSVDKVVCQFDGEAYRWYINDKRVSVEVVRSKVRSICLHRIRKEEAENES